MNEQLYLYEIHFEQYDYIFTKRHNKHYDYIKAPNEDHARKLAYWKHGIIDILEVKLAD